MTLTGYRELDLTAPEKDNSYIYQALMPVPRSGPLGWWEEWRRVRAEQRTLESMLRRDIADHVCRPRLRRLMQTHFALKCARRRCARVYHSLIVLMRQRKPLFCTERLEGAFDKMVSKIRDHDRAPLPWIRV